MNKNFKKKTLVGLAIIGVSALIIWIGPLAPSKELVVITKQMPKLDGSEGTSIAYSVYYIWDDTQEEHPWWVIFQAPLRDGDFEWAVLEVADVGDVYDTDKFMKAIQFASKFDKNWFRSEMYRVQRTSVVRPTLLYIWRSLTKYAPPEHSRRKSLDSGCDFPGSLG